MIHPQNTHELNYLGSRDKIVNVHLSHDRDYLEALPLKIKLVIEKRGLVTPSGNKVNFCGVILIEDSIYAFFPRKTIFINNRHNISVLIKTIRKYHALFSSPLTSDDDGAEMIGVDRLSLITALLEDYSINGIYSERQSYKTTNSGKPNWSRTINRQSPVSSGGNLVYLDFESQMRRYNTDSEISKIHSYIIKSIDHNYGQLLFGKQRFNEHHIAQPISVDDKYLIMKLKKGLSKVYSDRDIWLLRSLIELLMKTHDDKQTDEVIGVKHFHYVWEYMLSRVIPGELPLNSKLPIPTYKTESGSFLDCPQKGQRTDIIISDTHKTRIAVIDAKYYDTSNISGAPGWPDLVKQFFYARPVKSIFPSAIIRNYFIFPGTKPFLKSAHMKSRKNLSLLDAEYGVIECTYLCPAKVMDAFNKNSKLYDLEEVFLRSS